MSLCLSPHHLALQFYEFGPFGGALDGPPGEQPLLCWDGHSERPVSARLGRKSSSRTSPISSAIAPLCRARQARGQALAGHPVGARPAGFEATLASRLCGPSPFPFACQVRRGVGQEPRRCPPATGVSRRLGGTSGSGSEDWKTRAGKLLAKWTIGSPEPLAISRMTSVICRTSRRTSK